MNVETIKWKSGNVELIDQRLLPGKCVYIKCRNERDMFRAIKELKVRGAPAIGVAGAYGLYLGVRKSKALKRPAFMREVKRVARYLGSSRPTARNLFWALERMQRTAAGDKELSVPEIKDRLLNEAHKILEEDNAICRAIGINGGKLIKKGSVLLTHCNAGGLATAGYGTALSVIFAAAEKLELVYVDETRPVLQGSRLTAWELKRAGVPSRLICDNMAASLMAGNKIDGIVVGADRIAANGDTANKIGTYGLAVLAKYHKVPFYVAAPASTFDLSIATGEYIEIEQRDTSEVSKIGKEVIAPRGMDVYNPAFDVTPAKLITAIVTENGIIERPTKAKIAGNLAVSFKKA